MFRKSILSLCALSTIGVAWSAGLPADSAVRGESSFAYLELHLEVDFAELTGEVVLEVKAADRLSRLTLFDPLGKPVWSMVGTDVAGSGMSEVALELGAETIAEITSAYPEGTYYVQGMTVAEALVSGSVELTHKTPGRFHVLSPLDGQSLPREQATVTWSPSVGATRYLLEVERSEVDFSLELVVPASETSFTIPAALLESGARYEYSLVAEGDTDNELELEGSFYLLD